MNISTTLTKGDELKQRVIQELTRMVNDFEFTNEDDMNDGIKQQINETRELIEEFKNLTPEVFIFVQGGNIQGISANTDVSINIYDMDNHYADPERYEDENGTPEEWEKMIETKTNNNEIKGVY
jgi:hypothetical protein